MRGHLVLLLLVLAIVVVASRPEAPPVANPYEEGLRLVKAANTTNVLVVTYGCGPITGYSPWDDLQFWQAVAERVEDVALWWYNGLPSADVLANFSVVIYTAGGYWFPFGCRGEAYAFLRAAAERGLGIIVVAPDINYQEGPSPSGEYLAFLREVLGIAGALGLMYYSDLPLNASGVHPVERGLPSSFVVKAVNSWPDVFDPAPGALGLLPAGRVVVSEFAIGTAAGLYPAYSEVEPTPPLYALVVYKRAATLGFVPYGLWKESPDVGIRLGVNLLNWALGRLSLEDLLAWAAAHGLNAT